MAGEVIRVCPPRVFDFSNIEAGGAQHITVAERIDVSQYARVDLMVRVHDALMTDEASIGVEVVSDGFTTDDPARTFFSDPLGSGIGFNAADAPTAGAFELETLTGGLGSLVAVRVFVKQGAGDAMVRLSIDLALKTT